MSNVITLVKASTLKTRLTALNQNSKSNTLSLAYYTMINGNVAPLEGCDRGIATLLDRVYRQFVCATFDPKEGKWVYSKAKATKWLESLGLEFNNSTFEDFVNAVESHEETALAQQAAKEEEEKALTPEAKLKADKERVLKYLIKSELSINQLKDVIALVERERSKQEQKNARIVSATVKKAA